jgi:hypothetical protein
MDAEYSISLQKIQNLLCKGGFCVSLYQFLKGRKIFNMNLQKRSNVIEFEKCGELLD